MAFAVSDSTRIVAVSPAAAQAGLDIAMRRAGAAVLAPDVVVLTQDTTQEQHVLHEAALALFQYTPDISVADDRTLLLKVDASLAYFGGPRRLFRKVCATLASMHLHAQIGMAPTAQGAWLLAHQRATRARRRVLAMHSLRRHLDTLPCILLPTAEPHREWLHSIGCRTLSQLSALPRAGLGRRCGPALLHALDTAYGHATECHTWVRAPARFQQRIELPDYINHNEAIVAWAQRLIEPLCGWLTAHRLATDTFTLGLEHERGLHARPATVLTIKLATPSWQPSHLLSLLREKLGRLPLESGVIALTLNVEQTTAQPTVSTQLFPDPGGSPSDHARLVDLLSARLGKDRVKHAQPLADHRPEAANQWCAALDASRGPKRVNDTPPFRLMDRPFWLLDPPVALPVRQHRPTYCGQPLRLIRGPERIETGWWDSALTVRDYFVAEDASSARYWIYRERDTDDARWFLHGRYA